MRLLPTEPLIQELTLEAQLILLSTTLETILPLSGVTALYTSKHSHLSAKNEPLSFLLLDTTRLRVPLL